MAKICFAVLAHAHKECLKEMVRNLRHFEPDCEIVVFNGGTDPSLTEGLDVRYCKYSIPLKWGRLEKFHIFTMKWISDIQLDYEFLVTLDADMLLIRPGFSSFLKKAMNGSEYMALLKGNTGLVTPQLKWRIGKRFLANWNDGWQDVFGIPAPYGCFNPGQVFRKSYVRKFLHYKKFDQLMEQIDRVNHSIQEEIIFPTMAKVLNCNPKNFPHHRRANRYRKPHTSDDLKGFLRYGKVYLIHPVPMNIDTPARQFVRYLQAGRQDLAMGMEWNLDDVSYKYDTKDRKANRQD